MLIERVVAYDLEGAAELDFQPGGLLCLLSFPIGSGLRIAQEEPPASAAALG